LVCSARSVRSSEFLRTATRISVTADIRPAAADSNRSLAPTINPIAHMSTTAAHPTKNSGELARNDTRWAN